MTALRIIPLLLCIAPLCGAQPERNVVQPLFLTRLGVSSRGSGGTGVAEAGLPDAPLTNPGALFTEGVSFYAEGASRAATTYVAGLGIDGTTALPSYVCLSAGLASFTAAAGYAETYDHRLTSGPIEVTTVDRPDGTGEFYTMENRRRVTTAFGALSYRFTGTFSAGVTARYSTATLQDKLWNARAEARGNGWGITAGVLVRPFDHLQVGLSASYVERMELPYTVSAGLLVLEDPTMKGNGRITAVSVQPRLFALEPVVVRLGASMELTPSLAFLYAVEHTGWAAVADGRTGDSYDVAAGLRFIAAPWLTLRAGLFHHPDPPVPSSNYFFTNGQYDQDLFSAGAELTLFDGLRLSAAVTQCFLSTTKDFGQGDVLAGVQYSL